MTTTRSVRIGALLHAAGRVALSVAMVAFGMVKVIPTQFIAYTLPGALLEPVADLSDRSLLWTFMAASSPYTVATGVVEVIGGILLVWRRTVLAGAGVSTVAMTQVLLLNLTYDVPVLFPPAAMLACAVALTVPWWPRLWALVCGSAVPAAPESWGWSRGRAHAVHLMVLAAVAVAMGVNGARTHRDYTQRLSGLDGLWSIAEFRGAGPRWHRLAVEARPVSTALIVEVDGGVLRRIPARTVDGGIVADGLALARSDEGAVVEGTWNGAPVLIRLKPEPLRTPLREFR
ncbi:hypothetical protein GCM10027289_13140 [Tsukamurella serpentis]